jgi:hypothetical protein
MEILETLQGEFDEAAQHVLQKEEFAALRLSAVRALPIDRLSPGALGWIREVRLAPGTGPETETAGESLLGWLYLVAHPEIPLDPGRGAADPIQGTEWSSFVFAGALDLGPHALIAAKAETGGTGAPLLKSFAEAVGAELRSESEY